MTPKSLSLAKPPKIKNAELQLWSEYQFGGRERVKGSNPPLSLINLISPGKTNNL